MGKYFALILIASLILSVFGANAQAQDSLSLAITPPLIKNNVNPGQVWKSTVKLVNNNPEEMEAHVEIRDFKGGPETGTVVFLNAEEVAAEEGNDFLLSRWISFDQESINVPAFGSVEIPYSILVPETAEPGGHYAAILAGSRPPEISGGGSAIKISSLLASLILLNVGGDTEERGQIREFSTDHKFYARPEVNFKVRFENTGNIHIQPQGEIRVTNMFKKDVGVITINHHTDFGNVLPQSIRQWQFNWQQDDNFLKMGRYKAVVILSYGERARETTDRTLYFWVINWKLIFGISGLILLIIFIIITLIRIYIKKAIIKTQKMAGLVTPHRDGRKHKISVIPEENSEQTKAKIKHKGQAGGNVKISMNKSKTIKKSTIKWSSFKKITIIIVIILLFLISVLVVIKVNKEKNTQLPMKKDSKPKVVVPPVPGVKVLDSIEEKRPEVVVEAEATSTLNKATTTETEAVEKATSSIVEADKKDDTGRMKLIKEEYSVTVLNGTGIAGLAGKVATQLRNDGFIVEKISNASNYNYHNTLIQHSSESLEAAEYISKLLPIEADFEESTRGASIIIIIGRDYK